MAQKDKVYLRIYQSADKNYSYSDLFKTGLLSRMIGHGRENHELKDGSVVLIVAKSNDPKDLLPLHLGLFKVRNQSRFNPWKSYGDFICYDCDLIVEKTINHNSDEETRLGRVFDVARSIGTGHQNSEKTRELSLYMFLNSL